MTQLEKPSRALLTVLAWAVVLLALTPRWSMAQGPLTNGQNYTGTISAPAETDEWTFNAAGGSSIVLSIGEVGADSPFWPWIKLYGPGGTQLASSYGALGADVAVVAPSTGSYTVIVDSADSPNTATGTYSLTLALMPGGFVVPAGDEGGPLTNGANHGGVISRADLDMWSFTADAGESVVLSIGEVGPDSPFYPWIGIYGPNGARLTYSYGALGAEVAITAPTAGAYTVLVYSVDSGHSATGTYFLTIARIPGAFVVPPGDEGGPLTNGANHPGVITRADLDLWSFTANGGESLLVSIGEVGADSPFYPWIGIYGPNGARLTSSYGALGAEVGLTAPSTGTYTVLVDSADNGHSASGAYILTLARMPGPFVVPPGDEGGPMTNGANHPGTISRADLDLWSFSANGGESVVVTIGEVGADSPFYPWIGIYGPNGARLAYTYGALGAEVALTAPTTGNYTVLVDSADSGHSATGTYVLRLAKIPGGFVVPPGDEGGALTNGANHIGVISRADLDLWSFTANGGESLIVSIGEVGADSPFYPWVGIYGPNGARLDYSYGALGAEVAVTAPVTGTFTVLVESVDSAHSATGTYVLRLAKVPGKYVVPAGDEGGPMANGTSYPGVIQPADLDQWSFSATAGHMVTVGIGEVGADSPFYPSIRLYRPNGTLLRSSYGALSAQITVTIPETGHYTVVVESADSAHAASGAYSLRATGIDPWDDSTDPPNPFGDVILDFGSTYGLWMLANQGTATPQWLQLHGQSPSHIAVGDLDGDGTAELIAAFAGAGTWIWKATGGWTALHPLEATAIVTGDLDGNRRDEIILNLPGAGIWIRNDDGNWRQLHSLNSTVMSVGQVDNDVDHKADVIIDFRGHGLWAYMNNGAWSQVNDQNVTDIHIGDLDGNGQDDLILNFPGAGVWIRSNNGSWSQLHPLNSSAMTIGNIDGDTSRRKDIVLTFPGYGLYAWINNAAWIQLHDLAAPVLATVDVDGNGVDDIVIGFAGHGAWLWKNNASYEQLHPADIKAAAAGRLEDH